VVVTGDDDAMPRLIAVVERQRRELDRMRAAAAAESVVAMARGALMERLGLSATEAAGQLAELSEATGVPLAEMAAAVLSPPEDVLAAVGKPAGPPAGRPEGEPGHGEAGHGEAGHGEAGRGEEGRGEEGRGEAGLGEQALSSLLAGIGAELAADGAELVGTLAEQVLSPLGATAVVLWLLEADGALALLGQVGLSVGEASRWRHVPPQLDCPAQRVAHGAADLWWPAGRHEGDCAPVVGKPGGARAVLALRERNGELRGVLETIWPEPLADFTAEARQHLPALAAGCARILGTRLALGDLAAAQPKAALFTLLDDLADSVLVLRAIRDGGGQVADFSIEHVSPGYRDPAGRPGTDLTGLTLLEAYPASVSGQGLFARALQVLADGVPQHLPGPLGESLGLAEQTHAHGGETQADAAGTRAGTAGARVYTAGARADTAEARMDTAEARMDTAEARMDTAGARADTGEAWAGTAGTRADTAEVQAATAEAWADAAESQADTTQEPVPLADLRAASFFDGVIVTWRRDDTVGQLSALLDHAQRLGRLGGWEENLVTGTVRWTASAFDLFGLVPRPGAEIPLADLHSYVMAADKQAVKRFSQGLAEYKEAATATFRVVHPDDRGIRQIRVFAEPVVDAAGLVVALHGAFQDVSSHYHTQVALAATQDQLADTEQRVAEERLLALRLQQAIMPPDAVPVEAAGIDVAVRYRPVGQGQLVGGDWYDTLLLPGNDVLLVVGDVAGHGIDAVTGMVAARNSLRGLAITGTGPAELLRMLNGVMCHLTSGVVGTVVCGLYSPDTRLLRWARAGHLPPVLVRNGTARTLPLPGGVLLGMDPDAEYEEATQSLEPGDRLLLFTDGLIERRGDSIEDVLGEFVTSVAANLGESPASGLTAAALADRVLGSTASDTGDDACLVVIRIH
jgi:serine phosphatase RsbU (regulator of sigma subunit)